jgi:hypothetical protein
MIQENSPSQMTSPPARQLLRVSSVSVAKIEAAGGMEFVCMAVMQGMPHSHIAEALGIARSDLGGWLHNQNDPSYHLAMLTSAEALYDRAEDVLCQAKGGTMADVQIAREIASLCIRRAGIRNALFRDKATAISLTAPTAPAVLPQFTITIAPRRPGAGAGRLIEHDPGD